MKVGIIGATGYGGLELIRLLHNHPEVKEIDLFTSSEEGVIFSSKFSHLVQLYDQPLHKIEEERLLSCDVLFFSTPAGVTTSLLPPLLHKGPKLIDLAGDFRLKDPTLYEQWYKKQPATEELLNESVYGLTEWNYEAIRNASFIANPGCYPTAVLLSLLPLLKEQLIDSNHLFIDAKSGISGAGNTPSQLTHFSEANENLTIYKLHEHQHIPEIEQANHLFANVQSPITFTTHLIPMTRGIMTSSYAPIKEGVTEQQLYEALQTAYIHRPFVRVKDHLTTFSTKQVAGSNYCDIQVKVDERTNRATIVAVIDNLVKGAAGQAIQNMNVQCQFEETAGLNHVPFFL